MIPASGLPTLGSWQNFYMLIGTAAATLTGLMFVVTTLITGLERHVDVLDAGVSAFNTPTVVHFCAVLLMAGILSLPWPTFSLAGFFLSLTGLAGALYLLLVMRRMRRIPGYRTPLKDWLWYLALPLIAYSVLIIAGIVLPANPALGLFIPGAVMLVLLFIGIRNAWDLVTFLAIQRSHSENRSGK